jgi:uncharacterized protein
MPSTDYGSFRFGNVQSGPLDAITDNATFNAIRSDLEAGTAICRQTCDYFSFCGGGAPSNKYFENGSFASGETMYCRFTIKMPMDLVLGELEQSLGLGAVSQPRAAPAL